MELQQAIELRRSIRKFKNNDVDDGLIEQLLEVARIAPSAKNMQPWRFYVARNEVKNNIAQIMKDYHYENPTNTIGMLTTANSIEQAPVLILIFREPEGYSRERNDILSMGASIEHILLKATELGLGSLWICAMYNVRDKISKLIGTNLELYSCVAIGYADEEPSARPRKSMQDIVLN